jgi:hypothetical protein
MLQMIKGRDDPKAIGLQKLTLMIRKTSRKREQGFAPVHPGIEGFAAGRVGSARPCEHLREDQR